MTVPVVGLTETQVERARKLWRDGCSLEEIATRIDCGLFDLSPWLYLEDWKADAAHS